MPMPEGLAPLKVEDVDREMELVISQYTAEGRDVLAHCRGGLGRVRMPDDLANLAASNPSAVH